MPLLLRRTWVMREIIERIVCIEKELEKRNIIEIVEDKNPAPFPKYKKKKRMPKPLRKK